MDEPLSNSPEKEQGELFIIDGNSDIGKPCMFGRSIYFPVFYCLGYFKDMSTDLSEEQVSVERDWYLNEEKDIIMYDTRD